MLKNFFKVTYHFIWYLTAGIILAAAVSVAVVRLALTEADSYRNEIQSWVSEYIGHPVVFSKINIGWHGWMLQLSLSGIELPGRDGKRIISRFDSVHININPLKSLRFKKIISDRLILSGVRLGLTRTENGAFIIADDEAAGQSEKNFDASTLFSWILNQTKITLRDTEILWTDEKLGKDTIRFTNVALNIETYKDRVQIDASSRLPGTYGDFLELKLDAKGDLLTPDWSGKIYLEAKNIDIDQFLPVAGLEMDQAASSFKIWTNWGQAELTDLNGIISYLDLNIEKNATALSIPKLNAAISAKRVHEHDWSIDIYARELATNNGSWPRANYSIQLQRDKRNNYGYSAWLEYLNIGDAVSFVRAFTEEGNAAIDTFLNNYGIGGALHNFTISYFPGREAADLFNYHATFSESNFIEKEANTAIYGLSGNFSGNAEQVSVTIDSETVTLEAPSYFDYPIWFSTITGRFDWEKLDSFNKLEIPLLQLNTLDFPVSLSGYLNFLPNRASPVINIAASLGKAELKKIIEHLPAQIPDRIKTWLSQLFYQGNVNSAGVVFRGRPEDYPFVKSDGVFKAVFEIENAEIDYKSWPSIKGLEAEVLVANDRLNIISTAGKIYQTTIEQGQLSMDSFTYDNPRMLIEGKLSGNMHDVKLFIEQSPLAKIILPDHIADLSVGGEMTLDIELDLPIKKTIDKSITVNGKMELVDAALASNSTGFSLQNISGALGFTENSFTANALDAAYRSHPIVIDAHAEDGRPLTFTLGGKADNEFIVSQIMTAYPAVISAMPDLQNSISGECEWTLELHKNQNDIGFALASDMRRLGLDLPAPLGKTRAETRNILLTGIFSESGINDIRIEYDSLANLHIDNTKEIHAATGKTAGEQRRQMIIEGHIETLEVSKWLQLLSKNKSDSAGFKEHEAMINVAALSFLGNEFNDVELSISAVADGRQIRLGGGNIQGEIFLHDDPLGRPATADFEHLVLSKNAVDKDDKIDISPDSLPEFEIKIDNLNYDNIDLGKVNIKASKIDNGMKFEEFSLSKSSVDINGTGTWHEDSDKNISISVFNFDMYAKDINAMLNDYGYYDSNMEEGEISVSLEANWDGAPMDFSLDKIDGVMRVDIGKGKLLDMSSTATRLLGLISLQTLPRRLSLDFSDIFGKGFAFDSIAGSFNLEHGNAYTNGLIMQGPSAEITIAGRTGLLTRDYDQSAVVALKISDTLPLASATLLGLGTGIGAGIFIAGKLFDVIPKQLDKLLIYRYTITGSWDNPVIELSSTKNEIPNIGDIAN